ncbi:MAG: DNA gyrase inhibitor YacG [Parvularculaceae bacterium]|nr:DNA gyrase inhibitor YacG [Parvularculaceae bacterium]
MSPKIEAVNDNAKVAPCPTCKAPSVADYRPFCSKRCADVDLHRWLTGAYAIPAAESDDSPDADDLQEK